ncbi:MAG: peptidase M14, partial [Acidobacteria bacterium]|nr:peptidase M14 [Acidobacteriota bacterium]
MLPVLLIFVLLQAGTAVPAIQELSPGTRYNPGIPDLEQVTGFDFGERITPPEDIAAYFAALAKAAPDRSRLVEYARSWEGRPLHVMVIGSAERISRLDQVKADLRRLADPRSHTAAEGERLVKELPVVTWLMHAVHGNEISSPEAAMAEAYHLLAAEQDAAVESILRESLVLIDPLENPDGRARFVYQNLLGRAAVPDPEPASAEHDEPWPGGRVNHYLFDMNRDWFAQTQLETRGRTKFYLEWYAHVVVDLHEMGGDSTYYFAPPADPLNPHITKQQAAWLDAFGRENARRFDERGFAYFVREVFDSFYPGYGESWPIFHGAIGMTYEQASARGLAYRRQDGTMLTYRQGTVQHFTAAITTAATAARNRERILRDFLEYRRTAVQEGERGPVRAYLMPPGPDAARSDRLARLIAAQGIEVRRAQEPVKAGERELPAGTYIVSAAQPAGRLVRNLMDPHTPQPEDFIREQDRRRKKRLPDQFYDLTAWSLPDVFDVEVVTTGQPVSVRSTPLSGSAGTVPAALPAARVGYLMPWGSGTATAVVEALQEGIRIRFADGPFTLSGRGYPLGTAIVRNAENAPGLAEALGRIAGEHGAQVVAIDSAYVDSGISLGSNEVVALKPPRVLLAWDSPAQSSSAGWARYILERRFHQPVTAVRAGTLGRTDLDRYDVLLLPSGNYSGTFSGDRLRRLQDWISRGGTLITVGDASRWAVQEGVGLLSTVTELRDGRPDTPPAEKDAKKPEPSPIPLDLDKAIQPDREPPESTPGALLRVVLDPEHWLSAGTDGEIQVIVEGRRVFRPLKLDAGRNVGVYAGGDRLVAGGLVWDEARNLLARK